MSKSRLESFSDAVIAIVMTILVLELRTPAVDTFDGIWDMRNKLLIYIVSFMTIAIYWINHHNLLQLTKEVNNQILWANIGFMFMLTFFPFVTAWYGAHLWSVAPAFTYAVIIFLADVFSTLLAMEILKHHEKDKKIANVLASRKKLLISIVANILAIGISFFIPIGVLIISILIVFMWTVPNPKAVNYFNKK